MVLFKNKYFGKCVLFGKSLGKITNVFFFLGLIKAELIERLLLKLSGFLGLFLRNDR